MERIKDLDEIPSPYLTGILDNFFDGKLTPFIETNRGCPFTCSFCHTGSDYFHKLNKFSGDRVKEEIDYIAKKASKLGITNLHMADVNFGMYPQDRTTCEFLMESKKKYGWPLQVMATTGKNSKARVIEITKVLGEMFSINMSMQSMDEQVLRNIKRSNIKLDHMIDVNNHLIDLGRSTKAELIIGLPGETKKTFIDGLNNVLNSKVVENVEPKVVTHAIKQEVFTSDSQFNDISSDLVNCKVSDKVIRTQKLAVIDKKLALLENLRVNSTLKMNTLDGYFGGGGHRRHNKVYTSGSSLGTGYKQMTATPKSAFKQKPPGFAGYAGRRGGGPDFF